MKWSEDRIEKLKVLWDAGYTASRIAGLLGDVSRDAVIGKVHRLKLKGRPSPIKRPDPISNSDWDKLADMIG